MAAPRKDGKHSRVMKTVFMCDACQGLLGDWQFCIRLVCRQGAESGVLPPPGKRPHATSHPSHPPGAERVGGHPVPSNTPSLPRRRH